MRSLRATLALLLLPALLVSVWVPHGVDRAGSTAPHVEAAGTQTCPTSHNESRCLACQAIHLRVVVTRAPHMHFPEAVADGGCWHTAGVPRAGAIASPTQPRAPPIRIA